MADQDETGKNFKNVKETKGNQMKPSYCYHNGHDDLCINAR